MSKGTNGIIRTEVAGSYRVKVVRLGHGLGIIANSGQAARRKVFYPVVTTSSSFGMTVAFSSWEERERFNNWMEGFIDKILNGRGFKAAMFVEVPSYRFTRVAVPEGPILYGEGLTDVGYETNISFVGATDPVDPTKGPKAADLAYFRLPRRGSEVAKHFYPAADQLSGQSGLEGALFDVSKERDGWIVGGGLRDFSDDLNSDIAPRGVTSEDFDPDRGNS